MRRIMRTISLLLATLVLTTAARAGFDIPWSSIDGGGSQHMTGGVFELSGTTGQWDAGASMAGGAWQVAGGFWPGVSVSSCGCPADLNHDGKINGGDIQSFVRCMTSPGGDCGCADLNGSGNVGAADLSLFISALTAGGICS